MAARTKVRFVSCPKCANILPELSEYSVYQCGGCDAVLRAKNKMTGEDGSVQQIEKERDGGVFDKSENFWAKDCGASEIERESDGVINGSIKERVFRERGLNLVSSSSSVTEKIEASVHNSCGYVEERNVGNQGGGLGDSSTNTRSSEPVYSRRKEGIAEAPAQPESSSGSSRPREIMDQCGLNRYANPGVADDLGKFSTFAYPDEGPSNYHLNSSYGHGMPEHGRAELLRKLNELEEQIIKSCVLDEEQKGKSPVNRKASPLDPYNGHVAYRVPIQPTAPNEHIIPPYVKQYGHRPAFNANNSDINMQNFFFHPKHAPNFFPIYEDPLQPQMHSTHSHQLAYDPTNADFNREVLLSYHHDCLHHQSCCNQNRHVPSQFPPSVFGDRKFPRDSSDSSYGSHANSATFGLQTYNAQCDPSALQLRAQQMHSRRRGDIDLDHGCFRHNHPRRFVANHGKGQRCRPIAGGAPFITCSNCFQLVKLPRRLKARDKNKQKLRCGACLMVSLVEVENKRLIVSVPLETKKK